MMKIMNKQLPLALLGLAVCAGADAAAYRLAFSKGENVGVKLIDVYTLFVHRVTKKVTAPDIERDLPPFYLAQGLGHLLPRLMPLNEPRGYLFASYISGDAEVKSTLSPKSWWP